MPFKRRLHQAVGDDVGLDQRKAFDHAFHDDELGLAEPTNKSGKIGNNNGPLTMETCSIGDKPRSYSDAASDEDEADLEELVFGTRKKKLGEVEQESGGLGFFIDKSARDTAGKSGAAWVDDDDDEEIPDTLDDAQPRGMGNMRFQAVKTGNRKAEYEKVVGEAPAWSILDGAKADKSENELLTTNFKYVSECERLAKGVLDFSKCCDANKEEPSQGPLNACEFHKSAQIALTAGTDCRLNLFQIDGKCNPKIHSFFTEKFPINCAHFMASGEEIVMTSKLQYFYSYDLISGKIAKIPCIKGTDDRKLRKFFVSPDKKHLLFISRFGQMHIVSASTKELVKSVKMNGIVTDVAFRNDGQQFYAFGEEGTVTLWDIRSRGCLHSFVDDGCTYGTSLSVSPNGQYIACGSQSGIVNLYDESCLTGETPKPIRTFKNLQYSAYCSQFNSTSEILALASSEADNAVKLVHVPSLTVFNNFPGFKVNYLKLVRQLDFSPNSGYVMFGNHKGRALMFRLGHYKSY